MTQASAVGLSASQVRDRLERDGPNELPRKKQRTAAGIAIDVIREPMLAMLLAAGGIYLLLGDGTEAAILTAFAGLSIVITIVQEARTERALDALRELAAPRALVIRDGQPSRIPGREVVQGDIVVLEQGDRVPADAALLEASNLEVDESLLTGESLPVRKQAAEQPGQADDNPGQVFSGSIVTAGNGVARVTATGRRSRIGEIGRFLETLDPEVPQLRRETSRIVLICAVGGIATAITVFGLYGIFRGGWLDALLAGIATAMTMLPEEFPVVVTIFLAMGAWRISQVGVLTRRTAAIEALGSATVLCTDKTGTLTMNRMSVSGCWLPAEGHRPSLGDPSPAVQELLEASAMASAPVPADPMEIAFHAAARDAGVPAGGRGAIIHSYALRPDLLAMSNVWQTEDDAPLRLTAKGAPEAVARLCHLDTEAVQALHAATEEMARKGWRVIGVATATAERGATTKAHEDHAFRLLGLVALADPLRPGVTEAIQQCRAAGVRVVMITGDYAATAQAIAAQAGVEGSGLMTGQEMATLSEQALAARVKQVSVFARVMPDQKLRIVSALKAAGEVVAMTGDGVNDAPALKAAHIGIAMGKRGTDVAREAASIVLVDDDFGAIVSAIRMGRRIYDNIRKALGFIFGVHVPIAGLAVLPLATGLPIVLGPIQIALLEMVIDPVCALVFEAEREEAGLMQRPPRPPAERLFSTQIVARGIIQGGLAFMLTGALFMGASYLRLSADELRAFSFFGLLAAIIALILANRSYSSSLHDALMRDNPALRYILAFAAGVSGLILGIPAIRHVLKFAALDPSEVVIVLGAGALLLLALEGVKLVPGRWFGQRR